MRVGCGSKRAGGTREALLTGTRCTGQASRGGDRASGRCRESWTGAGDGRQDAAPCDAARLPPKTASEEAEATVIASILEDDKSQPARQKHTTKRIFERLRAEYGFGGGHAIVIENVRL